MAVKSVSSRRTKVKKAAKVRVPSGYIVEEFDLVHSGYGNLMEERFTMGQAIKHFCVECQGGHYFDWRNGDGTIEKKSTPLEPVRDCPSKTCYLYQYRLGTTGRKRVPK